MRLKVLLPNAVVVDTEITKVTAEAQNGSFCLEPRHIDFVSALVPGLLSYVTTDGAESFVGIDEGILVKCGTEVRISTLDAVAGDDPRALKSAILDRIRELDDHERQARGVLARLEADVSKRFLDLKKVR